MKYRPLANTGVFVSELCLGAMTFGSQWEMIGALGQKDADALVHRSLDEGINFFDTADIYSSGESEEILGRSLKGKRQDAVIATKVRGRMGPGANQVGLSRLHIIQAAEASLKRPMGLNDAIAIRSMMNLCMSFDHRINDGAEASRFMQAVKQRLEAIDPATSV